MRNSWMICLLLGTMAWAQAKPAAPATPQSHPPAALHDDDDDDEAKTPASNVAPDAAVLTIKGLCSQSAADSGTGSGNSNCQTVITRAQFESLVGAIQPAMDSKTRNQFATSYPQTLIMAHEAERRGLDKGPRFEERLRFARLQILSQELVRQIQEEAAKVPEKDIQDYYEKHSSDFQQANLERIVVPNRRQPNLQANGHGTDSGQEAEVLHDRAVQGEDFTKLQKEAFDFAGVSGNNSPNPSMNQMRRRGLPLAHASVFDLQPGQVSSVLSDATGRYIYKLDSKSLAPLDAVEQEISNTLRRGRIQQMIQSLQQPFTTDVNHTYFAPGGEKDDD